MYESENNFKNEKQLLIELSKLTKIDEEKVQMLSPKINYFELFKYAAYHKTISLCWYNLKRICPKAPIPKYLQYIVKCISETNIRRNTLYLEELKKVREKCIDNNITIFPVKGCMLIPLVYKDYSLRYMGDIDCLISKNDIEKLNYIMDEMGYKQGKYNAKLNCIEPESREELIKWKLYMSNLYPFRKMIDSKHDDYFQFDFRFSLDDLLKTDAVEEILDNYRENSIVSFELILLHLCTHFYNEALHTISIYFGKDLNIMKLCDIREFILQCKDIEKVLRGLTNLARKYKYEKAVSYTLFCLYLIYKDGYELIVLQDLQIQDKHLLQRYGENLLSKSEIMERSFEERLFSCDNKAVLKKEPSFFLDIQ